VLSKHERERRDIKIMQMFVAGFSLREIGSRVNLTGGGVHKVVHRELKREAQHQQLASDEALSVYTKRLERLLAFAWKSASEGELKAIETCRRILEQMGRLYSIEDERQGVLPPNNLLQDLPDELDPRDELAKFRARQQKNAADSFVHEPAL